MPDPTTPAKGLTQPQVGGDNNTWGGLLNADLALIDSALGGTLALSISGNTTLTNTQAQNTGYEFTGTLSGTAPITWPSFSGLLSITNGTSGSPPHPISCGISGGTFISVLYGETVSVWSDGTNFTRLAKEGGNLSRTSPGVVMRTVPSTSLWEVVLPDGTLLNTSSSTSMGLQEAINYALPRGLPLTVDGGSWITDSLAANAASGASSIQLSNPSRFVVGDDLQVWLNSDTTAAVVITSIVGSTVGISPSLSGAASSGNNVYSPASQIFASATITVPACSLGYVELHNVQLYIEPSISSDDGLVFSSAEILTWIHNGVLLYSGSGSPLHIAPNTPAYPVDNGVAFNLNVVQIDCISVISGSVESVVNFDITNTSILDNKFSFREIFGGSASSPNAAYGIGVQNPGSSSIVFEGNRIEVSGEIHGVSHGGAQVGFNTTNQANLRRNIWIIDEIKPGTGSSPYPQGFNTFGSNDIIMIGNISNEEGDLYDGVGFNGGTAGNVATYAVSGYSNAASSDAGSNLRIENGEIISNVGISCAGGVTFTGPFLVQGSLLNEGGDFNIGFNPPGSSSATGSTGQMTADTNYIYICTATNTWKRVALSSF